MKTLVSCISLLGLASCGVEYQSPRTGLRYSIQVPYSSIQDHIPKGLVISSPEK